MGLILKEGFLSVLIAPREAAQERCWGLQGWVGPAVIPQKCEVDLL